MKLTHESEALLRNLRVWTTVSPHWEGPEDEVWSYVALDLTRLEAAVRAEQAAEVERLRAALLGMHEASSELVSWMVATGQTPPDLHIINTALYRARAALAATPVAPFRCPAVLFHGPGHQSKSTCERDDPHPLSDDHWAEQSWRFEWTGDDEAPVAPAPAATERCAKCGMEKDEYGCLSLVCHQSDQPEPRP